MSVSHPARARPTSSLPSTATVPPTRLPSRSRGTTPASRTWPPTSDGCRDAAKSRQPALVLTATSADDLRALIRFRLWALWRRVPDLRPQGSASDAALGKGADHRDGPDRQGKVA